METLPGNKIYPFLQGGGEMGELTGSYDWSNTGLGLPDEWPQSLRTTVGNLLRSKFPMCLWWGEDLIQFYNDAYRPSFGKDGKHPAALGQKGRECGPEIWDTIYPLIQQVKSGGESTWIKDQLIPIFRNGRSEGVYWTFSYSLVLDDDNRPGGVLVTCMETTRALEESEERFRTMAEGTDILIAVGDETGAATYFNQAWVELTGRPMQDLLRFGWADLLHPEDKDVFLKNFLNALRQRQPFSGEFRILSKEGDYHWLIAKGPPRFNSDGSFAGYVSSCVDITDRKATEQAIRESETKLRSIIAAAPAGIGLFMGRDLIVEMPNQTFIDIVGKGADIEGRPLREVMPELITENQPFLQILDDVYTSGKMFQSFGSQVKIVQNGVMSDKYYNITYTPLFNTEGKVYAILDIAVDVTEQALARQKLELSENNLRNMILQAPVAMCILRGPEYVVEIANERVLEIWGKKAEDVMNKPIFEGLPEVKGQGVDVLLNNVYTSGETFNAFERRLDLPRGNKIETTYINFVYEPFYGANGVVSGIMVVAVEVTEQVLARRKIEEVVSQRTEQLAEANAALNIINKELQRSNANLGEFAHAASHDLKEPVRKISYFTQQLKDQLSVQLSEKELRAFERIEHATQRMRNLIDDLLLYSHISERPRQMEAVDLSQIIRHVSEDLELDIQEKKAAIRTSDLPVVQGHSRQLQQLFQNLLSNALKYSKATEPPIIEITGSKVTESSQPFHLISVKDNGIGFEQHYEKKIFQMFSRLHGKTEYSGTGVGLSIVKKVLENHNGFITVESEPGKGSTFNVYIPEQ